MYNNFCKASLILFSFWLNVFKDSPSLLVKCQALHISRQRFPGHAPLFLSSPRLLDPHLIFSRQSPISYHVHQTFLHMILFCFKCLLISYLCIFDPAEGSVFTGLLTLPQTEVLVLELTLCISSLYHTLHFVTFIFVSSP